MKADWESYIAMSSDRASISVLSMPSFRFKLGCFPVPLGFVTFETDELRT